MSEVHFFVPNNTPGVFTSMSDMDSNPRQHDEMDDDADDEGGDDEKDPDDDASSDFGGDYPDRLSFMSSHPLDLEGSIVVGGTMHRRGSICSCGTSTSSRSSALSCASGSTCDHDHHSGSCTSSRSTRGYSPTRDSICSGHEPDESLPYPGFRPVTLFCMTQTTHPRDWCLKMVINPYPFYIYVHI